jgi:two-component system, OmpR family, phosphate regulon sensor histidine kinase PhoR
MRIGLREKLFLISAGVLLVFATAAFVWLSHELGEHTRARLRADAEARATLVANELRLEEGTLEPGETWDGVAYDLASLAEARVTIFTADGRVAGDSAQRSTSPQTETLVFGAAPVKSGPGVVGSVRVGLSERPVADVRSLVGNLTLLGCAIGLVIAGVMSNLAARFASAGVRELSIQARRMAGGELEVRARAVPGEEDLADLGRSLEQLADGLRKSLRELVGERDLLSGILTSMREGVLLVDRDGRVALINPALREMLFLRDEDVGKLPIEVIRDSALHDLLDIARRSQKAAQGEIDLAGIKPRKILVRAEVLEVEPGGLLVVFHDVTDLRRLETLRRDFVANASHELRTPVTSIRSAVETLLAMPPGDSEAKARFFGIVERNAERLQQLIEDLLDLSKIESRELELASEPTNVRAVAERTIALFSERAVKSRTTLELTVPRDLPEVLADARALEQVLSNLLDNAIKYCPGAKITVGGEHDDAHVMIWVRDTGPGIEAKHADRLFERFYRVDAGRSRALGGTGLGLAIVKHLSEAMGGAVDVSSVVGEGTRFTLHLPFAEPPPRSHDSADLRESATS